MPDRKRGAAAERRTLVERYWSGLTAGIPDPRLRQLRDAQQSCRYPTREYQLDRPSLKMAPPRSLSGNRVSQIRPPRTVGRTNSPPLTKKAISTFAFSGAPSLRVRWKARLCGYLTLSTSLKRLKSYFVPACSRYPK